MALAQEIAQGAVAACAAKNFAVTATVVDRAGLVRAVLRADRASAYGRGEQGKSLHSASARNATTAIMENAEKNPRRVILPRSTASAALGGGLPVRAGDEVIAQSASAARRAGTYRRGMRQGGSRRRRGQAEVVRNENRWERLGAPLLQGSSAMPITRRSLLSGLTATIAAPALAQRKLRRFSMLLNTSASGPQAWFYLAQDRGYLAGGARDRLHAGGRGLHRRTAHACLRLRFRLRDVNALIELAAPRIRAPHPSAYTLCSTPRPPPSP